jgi:hypothetical protein
MPYWLDGNNLIGQPTRKAQKDPQTRAEFLLLLSDLASSRGGRFMVFFDGDDPDRRMPPRGVQVRYSAPLSADEAILRRLRELQTPAEVIVVSNDGDLRVRCQNAGAKTLTWGEFTERARPGTKSGNHRPVREEPVKIKEWMDYFGLTKDSLE